MPALERIRELYPDPPPAAPDARHRARLALAARMEGRSRRHRSRRLALPAAGLAAAAAAALITLVGVGDEAAIDAKAAAVLRQAAERTRAQPPLPKGVGIYTKSVNAYMTTWADRGNFSVLVPQEREAWIERNRTVIRTTAGEPKFLSERDRQRWIAAGRPRLREGSSGTFVIEHRPVDLPSDPDALFAAIQDEARGHSEGTNRQMFTRVGDYLREANETAALTLEQRGARVEVGGRLPGVGLIGEVRDPVGRKGVAVAMAQRSDGVRHTLVIESASGRLLAEEQVTLAENFYGYPAGTVVGHSTVGVEPPVVHAPDARKPDWAQVP
jgi:hypothetical protein